MLRTCVFFLTLFVFCSAENLFGPKYKPTKGALWPKPKEQIFEDVYLKYSPKHFYNITITGETCGILTRAIERYAFILRSTDRTARLLANSAPRQASEDHSGRYVQQLRVLLTAPCENEPYFGMDESYNLTVNVVSQLTSGSVWGLLRGLESWVQLFYFADDEPDIRINKTTILDAPRYPHRGLLIDTSRHFISLSKIQSTLDAMAMNKMNVLHWHIVDDQSFPYQSEKFPELSQRGAYHRSMVYTKADIQMVINSARDRGIRVLPEFDVPGHTRSWGESHPEILTDCYVNGNITGLGPMNPIHNATYTLLQELIGELQELFPETYFHVGGDEVDLSCWKSNPELVEYMRTHNMSSAAELHALFMERVIPLLAPRSKPIVWQEVYDESVPLPADTLVHVWKDNNLYPILKAGYKLLFSTAWYLDHLKSGGDWEAFYMADPREIYQRYHLTWLADEIDTESLADNIVGGEACMWGEVVDDRNFISRIWPRASAVAERLWSPAAADLFYFSVPTEVYSRLEEQTCRMARRGIPAQPPTGPGFCLGAL